MVRIRYFFDDGFVTDELFLLAATQDIHGPGQEAFLAELAQGFSPLKWQIECDRRGEGDLGVIVELAGNATESKDPVDAFHELGFGQFRR